MFASHEYYQQADALKFAEAFPCDPVEESDGTAVERCVLSFEEVKGYLMQASILREPSRASSPGEIDNFLSNINDSRMVSLEKRTVALMASLKSALVRKTLCLRTELVT